MNIKNSFRKIFPIFKRNFDIFFLIVIILSTGISIQTYNLYKSQKKESFTTILNNIYFKKTFNEIINNLEPKYKIYNHQIESGETFDKILETYSIDKEEIIAIKENLSKKININKLNTNQKFKLI